jgi:hypothetical protein
MAPQLQARRYVVQPESSDAALTFKGDTWSVRRHTGIMGSKPFIEVYGDADVALIRDRDALEEVDVLHEAVPLR